MDEATLFFSGVIGANCEVLTLVRGALGAARAGIVADAIARGYRLAVLSDSTGLLVVLLAPVTGRVAAVVASVDRAGRERIHALKRVGDGQSTNGENRPCRGARDAMTPGVMVPRWAARALTA